MMTLQSPAIAAALLLGLSGCTAPQRQSPAAQVSSSHSDSASNTQAQLEASSALHKTPLRQGTLLRVRLYHAIDMRQARHGDSFIASLSAPVVVADKTVLPKGTVVRGMIQQSSTSSRLKGRAVVTLTLDRMEWNGSEVPIDTNSVTWKSSDHRKRNLAWVGGGSSAGAVIGGLMGSGKSAAAEAGAGARRTETAPSDSEHVRIPAESILTFRLERPVTI
jgi:hypothetical protein